MKTVFLTNTEIILIPLLGDKDNDGHCNFPTILFHKNVSLLWKIKLMLPIHYVHSVQMKGLIVKNVTTRSMLKIGSPAIFHIILVYPRYSTFRKFYQKLVFFGIVMTFPRWAGSSKNTMISCSSNSANGILIIDNQHWCHEEILIEYLQNIIISSLSYRKQSRGPLMNFNSPGLQTFILSGT